MADLPAKITTPARIAAGESYSGALGFRGDRDWIRLEMAAGETVRITLKGEGARGIEDPLLSVHGPKGAFLESNDDGGPGRSSALVFTAPRDGPFYLEAAAFRPRDTGTYRLAVEGAEPPTDPLPSLDWGGARIEGGAVSVHFVPRGESEGRYTSEGLTAYERARFEEAFARIEAVIDLEFTVTEDPGADFRILLDRDEIRGNFLAFFNPPDTANAGRGIFDARQWQRDPEGPGDLDAGGYDFVTLTHEILHGLGLAHPHDTGGRSEVMWGVSAEEGDFGAYDLNQGLFTTMSYNTGYLTGGPGSRGHRDDLWGYEAGPMALDIAVLQAKYGANGETAAGDDSYRLPRANQPGTAWQAIWDTGGSDWLRHGGAKDAVLDLRAATLAYETGGGGFVSAAAGVAGGYTIAHGTVIENARGGRGDDRLVGNGADNSLIGRGGDDTLIGGAGDDVLRGGAGADVFAPGLAAEGRDRALDFTPGRDVIDLSAIDADAGRPGDQPFVLIDGAFTGTAGELRLRARGGDGLILGDTDGDGRAELRLLLAGAEAGAGDILL